MKLNLNGKDYSFKFFHENKANTIPATSSKFIDLRKSEQQLIRATTCMVFDEEGNCVSKGTANVHPNDNFNKEIGRKVSLKRTIQSWERDFRANVWESYRTWGSKDRW